MSKQLIDRKEQARMIARMNGSVIGISDTSYTVSSQSSSRNLGDLERERYEDIIQQQIRSSYEERS
jgi:coenzyme F420-reducing hydrogenase alpha subunit